MSTKSQRPRNLQNKNVPVSITTVQNQIISLLSELKFISVLKVILQEEIHTVLLSSLCVFQNLFVQILDASSHKKVIPDSDDKRDHYMKIWKSIIFTFRSTQTDQFNPNQYTLMEKCPCARYRTRSEGYKSETQPLPLSSKNLVEEEGKVK